MDAFTLVAKLTLNDAEFRTKLAQAEGAAEGGTKGLSKWGVTFGNVMSQAITATARAVKNFGVSVVQTGMEFDAAMSQVKALGQLEDDQFEEIRDKAIALGASTKFTASEVADAFSYMALAGWDTEEMIAGIDGVLNLAAASGENLAHTSDIVTDAITAFGLTADDAGHFVDVLAQASANSNTTVAMMGEAFKYLGNTAGTLNYSVEDVAVALGLMANTGIKASQAGTSMRQILNTMIAPTDAAAAAMSKLGLSLFETGTGKVKPLMQVMTEMRQVFKDSGYDIEGSAESLDEYIRAAAELEDQFASGSITEDELNESLNALAANNPNQQLLSALSSIGGLRGIGSLLAIMRASDEDFNSLVNDVYNSTGAAEKMAQTMLDNLMGDITIFNSAVEGLKIVISDSFQGKLRDFIQTLTEEIGNLSQAFQQGGVAGMFINLAEWIVNGITGALTDDSITGEKANEFGKAIGDFVGRLIGNLVSNAPELISGLFQAGLNLADGLITGMFAGLFGTGEGTLVGMLQNAQEQEQDAIAQAEEASTKASGIVGYMESLVEKYGEAASNTSEWASALGELEAVMPGITGYIADQARSAQDATAAMREYVQSAKDAAIEDAKRRTLQTISDQYVQAGQQYYETEIHRDIQQAQADEAWNRLVGYIQDRKGTDFSAEGMSLEQLAYVARATANEFGDSQSDIETWVNTFNESNKAVDADNAKMLELASNMQTLETQLSLASAALDRLAASASAAASAPLGGSAAATNAGEYYNWIYTHQHAKGLWDVPEDDYLARLHRGEMVLTADRAREYRAGNGGVDYDALVGAITGAVRAGMQGVEVNSYLNGRSITDTVSREMAKQLKAQRYAG